MTDMRQIISLLETTAPLDLKSALNALIADANSLGVKLVVNIRDARSLDLDFIQREGAAKGVGATVMQKLTELADARSLRIHLYAFAAAPVLMDYFERFGFEEDPRGDDEAMMRRLPKRRRKRPVTEAVGLYPLYHGTSLSGLLGIMNSGKLTDDGWDGGFLGASLTRSYEMAAKFAHGASVTRAAHSDEDFPEDSGEALIDRENGSGGAVIEFDRGMLVHSHRPTPYRMPGMRKERDEEEERLPTDDNGYTPPIRETITAIYLVGGQDVFDRYCDYVLNHPNGKHYAAAVAFIRTKLRSAPPPDNRQ